MTRADIEREILELVNEDLYGLWEIGWRLNTILSVDPSNDPKESAAMVESLTQRHLVDLYVRERIDDNPRPIAASGRSIDLTTRAAWLVPGQGEPQFLLGSWIEEV
jgi:hypothetical protein